MIQLDRCFLSYYTCINLQNPFLDGGARINQSLSPKQQGKESGIGSVTQSNLHAPFLHVIPEIMNDLDITKIERLCDSVITMKMS